MTDEIVKGEMGVKVWGIRWDKVVNAASKGIEGRKMMVEFISKEVATFTENRIGTLSVKMKISSFRL